MSFVSTYNSLSVRGFQSTSGEGYFSTAMLQENNTSSYGFTLDCGYSNYAVIGSPDSNTVYFYVKNNNNIFVNIGSNTMNINDAGFYIGTNGDASYTIVGSNPGTGAFIFERTGNSFTRTSLVGNGNSFGGAVAMANNGNYCAVSAPGSYIIRCYERNNSSWTNVSNIANTGNSITSSRVISMNEDGTKLVMGYDDGFGVGQAYVFSRSNTTWSLDQTLTASDGNANLNFGASIKIIPSGNIIAVGDSGNNTSNIAGGVYIFTFDNGNNVYTETAKVTANTFTMGFGATLDISDDGNVLIVGAQFANNNTGKSFVYTNITNVWTLINTFDGLDGNNGYFGKNVGITGDTNTLLIGSYGANSFRGKAYQYNNS